jgi:hypothetical protein
MTTTTTTRMMVIIIITAVTKIGWQHDSNCCLSVLPQRRRYFFFFPLSLSIPFFFCFLSICMLQQKLEACLYTLQYLCFYMSRHISQQQSNSIPSSCSILSFSLLWTIYVKREPLLLFLCAYRLDDINTTSSHVRQLKQNIART